MTLEISCESFAEQRLRDPVFALLDVRESAERIEGFMAGAIHIPLGQLESRIEELSRLRDQPLLVYCSAGKRSLTAVQFLLNNGFSRVLSLAGGIHEWNKLGLSLDHLSVLSAEQRARYHRQLILPEVGESGQQRLLQAKVLLVGVGGLGSPCALYLAGAGVGQLGLFDGDRVDLSNLQRQILHCTKTLGQLKVDSAKQALESLNPQVHVVTYPIRLTLEAALEHFAGYDVVVDGSDNFETRYLVNEACVRLGKPLVYGAVFRFQGQAMTFLPSGPCYRCLYPEAPSEELAPSCSEAGVLGVVPGMIGVLQATEVLKVLLKQGRLLDRLATYDALEARWQEFSVKKNPQCPTCRSEVS